LKSGYGRCEEVMIIYLKKAIEFGWTEFHWMDNDQDLQNLRQDPGCKEIRK